FFLSKRNKKKNIALVIFGFGLLFFGLNLMTDSFKPLSTNEGILDLFVEFGENPLFGVLIGLSVTVILQSSSTTIGMVIALAIAGLLDFRTAFFIILGDNVGTCVTALIASFKGSISSKRLALSHLIFNIVGTTIALIIAPLYLELIPLTSNDIARQVANAHTAFNIFNALIFLPLTPLYVRLIKKIIKGKDYRKKTTRYLDKSLLKIPNLAIKAVVKEMTIMLALCKNMLEKTKESFPKFDHKKFAEVEIDEDSIDTMQLNITKYIVEITRKRLSEKEATLIPNLIHSVNDIEHAGDHIEGMMKVAQRKYENKLNFTENEKRELNNIFNLLSKFIDLTVIAMDKNDFKAAYESFAIEKRINNLIFKYQNKHLKNLGNHNSISESELLYNDILTHAEKVGDYLHNITQAIVHKGKR
ncbi:Na/Pi symporter, partial [archaeon]|nr:Na/Pi symporter [archaeon]